MTNTEEKNDERGGDRGKQYDLTVNRSEQKWPDPTITGAQIKQLGGNPADWVVNQIIDGPGEDPEIADTQAVALDHDVPPKGKKKFTTRKPSTSPGSGSCDVPA